MAAREVSVASKKANILIRKGRVIDPASGRDEIADLLIENGRLVRICLCRAAVAAVTSPAKPAPPPPVASLTWWPSRIVARWTPPPWCG
jgi:hypothetical protein